MTALKADITPLQQASLAAHGDAVAFSALCDAFPLAVLVLDDVLGVHYANAAAERLLNVSAKLMQGKALGEVMALDAVWDGLLAQTSQFRQGVKGYDLLLSPAKGEGERKKVNAYLNECTVFENADKRGLLLVMEPCQVSEKLGSHASQRETMRSAAVMAEILAHEVRNPLSGIKGAAQLLSKTDVNEDDRELLALICSEVERIGGLLNQVEYFSTDRAIETEEVNIHEVLRYVSDLAAQGMATHVTFKENYDPSLPPVRGNRELLVQALLNLVKNAAEALEGVEEAQITLKTSYRGGYRVRVAGEEKPVTLPICVQVSDNGPGIAEELRGQIFDPFVTNKTSGKGLGLPVVAKVVADHGGVMALESAEPGQTTFALQLPAHTGDKG